MIRKIDLAVHACDSSTQLYLMQLFRCSSCDWEISNYLSDPLHFRLRFICTVGRSIVLLILQTTCVSSPGKYTRTFYAMAHPEWQSGRSRARRRHRSRPMPTLVEPFAGRGQCCKCSTCAFGRIIYVNGRCIRVITALRRLCYL